MNQRHQPEPEFVSHLEWQLRTALKRETRFSEPVRPYYGGKMKAAALILVSALMGAGGVVVTDEVQEARAQEILIAEITSDIEIASLELDVMMERFGQLERQFQAGVVGEEEILAARIALEEAEFQLAALHLDLEEIQASGEKPQNQVSAPLVGGRDFVTERLALRESVVAAEMELARMQLSRIQDLREAGLVNEAEMDRGALAMLEAESELDRIQERINVRRRFLEEGLEGETAELELEVLETQIRINLAEKAMVEAMIRYNRLEELLRAGLVHESELRAKRIEVARMEIELGRLQRQLTILRGGRPSTDTH